MSKSDLIYLYDISQSAELILSFSQKIDDYYALSESSLEFNAIIWRFVVIGEAVSRISQKLRERYQEVPWGDIKAYRNFLVHEYDSINRKILKDAIEYELPKLLEQIYTIIKQEEKNETK